MVSERQRRASISSTSLRTKADRVRDFLAPHWRKFIASSVIVFGLALFLGAEFGLGSLINDNKYLMAIALLLALVMLVVTVCKPLWGYGLWFFLTNYLRFFGHMLPARYSFDLIALSLLAIVLIFKALAKKQPFGKLSTAEVFLIIYFIYAYIIRFEFDTSAPVAHIKLVVMTSLFFYFITKAIIKEKKHVYALMLLIVITGVSFALMGIYEQIIGKSWLAEVTGYDIGLYGGMRSIGPAGNYYVYGNVMILTILLCVHILRWQQRWYSRFIVSACTVISIIGLYFNYSRGPYAAFCLSLIVMFFLAKYTKKTYTAIIVSLVLAGIIVVPLAATSHKIQNRFKEGFTKGSQRVATDRTSKNMFKDNFLFGVGKDNYQKYVPVYLSSSQHTYIKDNPKGIVVYWGKPHSEYYLMATELGIVGFFLYFMTYFLFMLKCARLRSILPKSDVLGSDFAAVAIAFTLGVLLTMYTDEFSFDPFMYAMLFTIYAMLAKLEWFASKKGAEV